MQPLLKSLLIAGIAHCTGSKQMNDLCAHILGFLPHHCHAGAGLLQHIVTDIAICIQSGKNAQPLPVPQDTMELCVLDIRHKHT